MSKFATLHSRHGGRHLLEFPHRHAQRLRQSLEHGKRRGLSLNALEHKRADDRRQAGGCRCTRTLHVCHRVPRLAAWARRDGAGRPAGRTYTNGASVWTTICSWSPSPAPQIVAKAPRHTGRLAGRRPDPAKVADGRPDDRDVAGADRLGLRPVEMREQRGDDPTELLLQRLDALHLGTQRG